VAQLVNTPWGELEFPDDMSQEQMESAIKNTKEFQGQAPQEAAQQPVVQQQSPAPQSLLSNEERNAITSAGQEMPAIETEQGSAGLLGLGKYFAREIPAGLMDMGSAVQKAFGYNDLDNLRVQQQADEFLQARKKQGIPTTLEDMDNFYANYKNTQQQTAEDIRRSLPVDESVKQSFAGQATKLVADTAAMVGANIATRGAAAIPTNAGFLAKWGYDDAKKNGATEQAARQAAYAYTPLALAPQMALTESLAAKFIKPLAPYVGRGLTIGQAKNEILKSFGRGAAQGSVVMGLQQTELNTLMKVMDIAPDRPLTQDVLHTMAMGAVMGGTISAAGTTFSSGTTLASPENKAYNLASRVSDQAKQVNLQTDALRKAAGIPDGSTVEKTSTKYAQNNEGQNSTEITYITPEGRRITLKVTGDNAPSVTPNPLLLGAPRPQTNTGQGEPVPVGTQTTQRINRETRQIESVEKPVTGPVIFTPPPLNARDNVRLDLKSPVGGKTTFIEGEVLPDKSGVRISYIPDDLAGDIAQLEATTTATGQPSKMPKIGDVVPMSVAERNFKLAGYRADSAWYSNMAEPRKNFPQTQPNQTEQPAELSVTQAQSNAATLEAAKRTGLPQEAVVEQPKTPYFPTAPDRSQAGTPQVEQKKEPAFPRRKPEVGRKKAEKDGRPYFPSAPDRMQYSERGVPTQEQKSYASRMGQALLTALRKIAPKGAAELEIFLGPKPEGYSDNAVAAYDPRRAMIWLSDRIATFKQQVGEFTHEAGHVFWDTLPDNVKRSFAELYAAEMRTKTGPLFNPNGNIKDGISPRIASGAQLETSVAPWDTVGLREWFAERIMVENSDWSMGKATTEGIIGRTAGVFRSVLQRISGALGQGDAMNNAFKSWAELGPRYGIKPSLGEPASPNVATRLVPRGSVQPQQEATRGKEEVKAELPRGVINDAVKIAKGELESEDRRFHENFFTDVWPRIIKDLGQKTLKPTASNIEKLTGQAVSDVLSFVSRNPDFANYYSKDIVQVEKYLERAFPEVRENPELKTAFKMFAALTSPDTSLESNMGEATDVFSLWLKDRNLDSIKMGENEGGKLVIMESPFSLLGSSNANKARAVKNLAKMINENGAAKTAEIMASPRTQRELNKLRGELGYKSGIKGPATKQVVMEATGQDVQIPSAYIFGPKVGSYLMNWLGDSRFTTIDIWESRFSRSYFPDFFNKVVGVDPKTKEPIYNTGLSEGEERAVFANFATIFNKNFEKRTGLKLPASALQALRWFYIIDATGNAGYKGAQSNEASSEYTRRALVKRDRLNESDKEDWRRIANGSEKPILLQQFTGEIAYREGSGEGRAGSLSDAQRLYDVRELTPEEFVQTASKNKSEAKFGTSVDVLSPEQYKDYDLVQASVGGETATVSVSKSGEIGSVTRSQNAPSTLIRTAMDAALHFRGGKDIWLNGFNTILPELYSDYGFRPVAKLKFNDEYRPDGWDYKAYSKYNNGRPDVVFMRYTGDFSGDYKAELENAPYKDSYESASELASGKPQMSERGQQEFRNNFDDYAYTKTLGMHTAEVSEMAGAVTNLVNSVYEGRVDPAALRVSTNKLRRLLVDKFADFKDFKKLLEKRGSLLPESSDFHTQEQNMHGIIGAKLEALYDAHETIIGTLKDLGLNKTIDAVVGGQKASMGMVDIYLYARHAPERNARIFALSNGEKTAGSGMTDSEAATILAKLAPYEAKLSTVARMVYDLNRTKLRMMENAGLISAEARQAIETRYPNYSPLIGKAGATEEEQFSMDTGIGAGMTMIGRDIKPAKGRYTASDNILANAFHLQQRAVVRSERNITLKALAKLAGEFTDNGLVEKVTELRTNENTLTPEIIVYKENGQTKYLRLLDDDLIKSFKQSRGQLDQIFSFMGRGTRLMASMATTYNPAFAVPNLVRDFQTAIFNMSSTEIAGLEKDFAIKMPSAMKAVWHSESQAFRSGKWNERVSPQVAESMKYYKEFRENGGQMIFMGLRDAEYYQKKIDALMPRNKNAIEVAGEAGQKFILGPYKEFLEHINSSLENATRLSAYITARERGLSPQKAANLSRNLTVNFTQRGQLTALNQIYMFFNASLAGSARMVETISTSPRGRAFAGSIVLAGFLQRLASRYLSDEDQNGIKEVDKVPAYQLSTNMVQALPNVPTWIKMPLAYGANVFWYLGTQMADMLPREYGGMGKSPLKATGEFVKAAMNAFNPIGGGAEIVNSLTPAVAQPFVDISINKNFAGQPIYPTDNPFDSSPDPYAFRTWSNPNPHIAAIVQSVAKFSGGNEVRPSLAEESLNTFGMGAFASPESVEYLFKSVFSGPYSIYSDLSKTFSGLSTSQGIDPNNLPIVRRFVGSPSDRSDSILFKEAWQNISTARDELKLHMKNGDRKNADRVRAEYPAELASYDQFSRINYQLKNLRTQAKSYKSKGDTEGELRVQKMIRETQTQALGQYKKAVDRMGSEAGDKASDQVKSLFY
jgi:Large polyvalent protein associated domain 38